MTPKTVQKLNQINADFYKTVGESFDQTRNHSWPGWDKLVEVLDLKTKFKGKTLKVIDLGCGNGRFAEFLMQNGLEIDYTGLDSNRYLLQKAKEKLTKQNFVSADLINDNWENEVKKDFDLVGLFGVMHHIPGAENRIKLITKASSLLTKDGILVFATWQFAQNERLQKRVVYPNNQGGEELLKELEIETNEMEPNDYILDWQRGEVAYRYCHDYTQEEVEKIAQECGLKIVETYLEDGKERNVNKYWILVKN